MTFVSQSAAMWALRVRPGQIFISSGAAGLGGEDFAVPGPRWWALDVPRYVSGE